MFQSHKPDYMNINSTPRRILYFLVIAGLTLLLIREYTYVHPFNNIGFFILAPRWTHSSTRTITWWFILVGSIILIMPLIRKQKIGYIGLVLFTLTFIRPYIQYKFPEQSALEFYQDRSDDLEQIIRKYKQDEIIDHQKIKKLGFEKLIVDKETFYFLVCDEEWPFGICYNKTNQLPHENFDRKLKYHSLATDWYEFDYLF